jgi:hypothetical protein
MPLWRERCCSLKICCDFKEQAKEMKTVEFIQPEGKRPLGRPRSRWEYNIFRKWDGGHGVD